VLIQAPRHHDLWRSGGIASRIISALDGGSLSASRFGRFKAGEAAAGTNWIVRGLVKPQSGVWTWWQSEKFRACDGNRTQSSTSSRSSMTKLMTVPLTIFRVTWVGKQFMSGKLGSFGTMLSLCAWDYHISIHLQRCCEGPQ
jgi:hypothetical protein